MAVMHMPFMRTNLGWFWWGNGSWVEGFEVMGGRVSGYFSPLLAAKQCGL